MLLQLLLTDLMIVLASVSPSWGVEEAERAIYLQPRNFNPHPLQATRRAKTGPVLFPENRPGPGDSRENSVGVDGHPYASVVRKHKYKSAGRFHGPDNHAGPQALQALAAHAAKVLRKAPRAHNYLKKAYAFSYKVKDALSGDDFSHVQEQKSGSTNGEYRVKLPDGRLQIVSYVADKDGYKAVVKYDEAKKLENEALGHGVEIGRTSEVRKFSPDYDYGGYGQHLTDYGDYGHGQVHYHPAVSTERPYYHHGSVTQIPDRNLLQVVVTTPRGVPTAAPPHINPFLVLHDAQSPKVQLFGSAEQKVGGKVAEFIGSTLAPFVHSGGFAVSSTLAPPSFSQVRISTPDYRLDHLGHHGLFY